MSELKQRIAELRQQNYSYRFIGDALSMSPNTVKSICRRKHFDAIGPRKTKAEKQRTSICKNCYRTLDQDGRKNRLFCSDSCRTEWWKHNRRITEK